VQLPQGRQARAANHAATDSDIRGIHTARLEHSKKSNPRVGTLAIQHRTALYNAAMPG
jgi:hypothetical protein